MSLFFTPLPPTYEAALRDVHAKDAKMRALAAARLGSPSDASDETRRERAVLGLVQLADDENERVRVLALVSIGRLADPRALPIVLARFSDAEGSVREAAVMAAGEIGGDEAREALARALRDERPDVRFQALAAYAAVAGEDARAAISVALGDPDPLVRVSAIESLSTLGPSADACTRIARALRDPDPRVADEAAIALGQLGDRRATPRLVSLIAGPRGFEAMSALGDLRASEAADALDRIASALLKPLLVKAAAAAALIRVGDPRGRERLRAVFDARRGDARTFCVEIIGELRLAEYGRDVVKLLERPRGAEHAAIVRTLARLSGVSAEADRAFAALLARDDVLGGLARACEGER